jgi:DNA replication protein DnaD
MSDAKELEKEFESLKERIKTKISLVANKILVKYSEDDDKSVRFDTIYVSKPIFKEDIHNEEMSQIISSFFINDLNKIGFEVQTFESEYDIYLDDLEIEMLLYLLDSFENVEI